MVDPDRRPTAQEIEELIDLVRRDPGSPAFIDLGEAYLALGRPRDAIQVGNLGLQAAPDNLEGRVMLARAFAALHQWKEAQGELLRVVKVDRSNRQGFALLGEVLLRRNDYERAVPVLQHAQNLDPTSPAILTMLKRARAGQQLDPPPPIPQPVPPRGETGGAPPPGRQPPSPTVPARSRQMQAAGMQVPQAAPQVPTMAMPPAPAPQPAPRDIQWSGVADEWANHAPTTAAAPPSFPEASAGYAQPPQPQAPPPAPPPAARIAKPTAPPPPMSVEGVRPRIISSAKVQNAAAASLRQSAAVGETYLNDLLTGGLLDVAGVRVPEAEYDLKPDRRWGRSTRRAFIFLFVVLVIGVGGTGTWYWWYHKQIEEKVARLQKDAKAAIVAGDYAGFQDGLGKLGEALKLDDSNSLTFAYTVEIGGLSALLYGTSTDEPETAYNQIKKGIEPGEPGTRELVIGHNALELAKLRAGNQPAETLQKVTKELDEWITKNSDDRWAKWLKGRAQLEAGDRAGARTTFKGLAETADPFIVAQIDLANIMIDQGEYTDALKLIATIKQIKDKTSDKENPHPLAVLAKSLGRAESQLANEELGDVLGDLNAKILTSTTPPRLGAYGQLVVALASAGIEDYVKATNALKLATTNSANVKPPLEARFWARVAWVNYVFGDLEAAHTNRMKIQPLVKTADAEPTVQLVLAAEYLAAGQPAKSLAIATKLDGVRAKLLKTQALLDQGNAKDALAESEQVLKLAATNVTALIQHEIARYLMATTKDARDAVDTELRKYVGMKSKAGRQALALALYGTGNPDAKDQLQQAIDVCPQEDCAEVEPAPEAYRSLTALADLAVTDKRPDDAKKYLDWVFNSDPAKRPDFEIQVSGKKKMVRAFDDKKARTPYADYLKASKEYVPAQVVLGRIAAAQGNWAAALEVFNRVGNDVPQSNELLLAWAEALASAKADGKAREANVAKATDFLKALKGKSPAIDAELARIAAIIDPGLPKQLELPDPKDPKAPPGAPQPPKKK